VSLRPATASIPRAALQVRFATQDYGSGQGNPVGENPQQQGRNPSENIEHPGPPPPKVAKGQSSSSPDSSSSSSSSSSQSSPSSSSANKSSSGQQQSQSNDGATTQGSNSANEVKGAQPKILNENPPSKDKAPKDVKDHNREFEQRAERAHEQVSNEDAAKDKVPKDFWAGQGGRDREP